MRQNARMSRVAPAAPHRGETDRHGALKDAMRAVFRAPHRRISAPSGQMEHLEAGHREPAHKQRAFQAFPMRLRESKDQAEFERFKREYSESGA